MNRVGLRNSLGETLEDTTIQQHTRSGLVCSSLLFPIFQEITNISTVRIDRTNSSPSTLLLITKNVERQYKHAVML